MQNPTEKHVGINIIIIIIIIITKIHTQYFHL
jgi:hypothetical protein